MKKSAINAIITDSFKSIDEEEKRINQKRELFHNVFNSVEALLAILPEYSAEYDIDRTRISTYTNSVDLNVTLFVDSFNKGKLVKLLDKLINVELPELPYVNMTSNDCPDCGYRTYNFTFATDRNYVWNDKSHVEVNITANLVENDGNKKCQRVVVGKKTVVSEELEYKFICK